MTETQSTPEVPSLFDPSEHNVDEVNDYLAQADDDERQRVLGLEDAPEGKARTTVNREHPTPEGSTDLRQPPAVISDDPDHRDVTTKGTTFQEAVEAIVAPEARDGVFLTETDRLADEGKTKGLTFAEQAALARDLYGSGNPADREG